MRPETDEFLKLVRDAHEPSAEDEARVLSALKATLAAGATSNAIVCATLARSRTAPPGAAAGAIGSKLTVVVACAAAALFGTGDAARSSDRGGDSALRAPDAARGDAPSLSPATAPAAEATAPRPRATPAADASSGPPRERAAARRARPPNAAPAKQQERRAASALRAELELLQRVQDALRRGDGAAALRALDAHVTDDRVLSAERAAARVLALCSAGRVAEARDAAQQFAKDHPDSVQREALARSCANF